MLATLAEFTDVAVIVEDKPGRRLRALHLAKFVQQALGTVVFAGMIGVTFFGIFLTPVFYSVDR